MNEADAGLPAELAENRLAVVVSTVLAHWTEVLDALPPPGREELPAVLATAGDRPPSRTLREIEDLLSEAELPADHPVRDLLLGKVRYVADAVRPEAALDAAAVRWLLAHLPVLKDPQDRRLEEVLHRLSALAALSEAQVRKAGGDPAVPELIRLRPQGGGEVRLPLFQFGPDGRALAVVVAVNRIMDAEHDPWGVASWWSDPHSWLGRRPVELLTGGRAEHDRLADAARAEVTF